MQTAKKKRKKQNKARKFRSPNDDVSPFSLKTSYT